MRPFLPWATAAFVPLRCQFVLSHNHSVSVLRARTHAFTSCVEPAPVPLHQRPSRNSWQMNRWTNKLNLKVIIYSRSKIRCYWRRVLLNLVSNESTASFVWRTDFWTEACYKLRAVEPSPWAHTGLGETPEQRWPGQSAKQARRSEMSRHKSAWLLITFNNFS